MSLIYCYKMFYKQTGFLSRHIFKVSKNWYSVDPCILIKEVKNNALITLNRQKYLNASIKIELYNILKMLEEQKSLIILKGLSANKDILELQKYPTLKQKLDDIGYLNASINLIHTYQVPIITLINGAVFGEVAGLAAFSKYRIATEETRFALPEIKIGFHPNGGSTYYLNQTKGKLGYYLALTGKIVKGSDTINIGLATHFCKSSNLHKLENQLLDCSKTENIDTIIENICEKNIPEFSLDPLMNNIDLCFSEPTVEQIIMKLKQDESTWAKETIKLMEKCSPSSLKVALKSLQKGANMDLKECLMMESILSFRCYDFPDLFEGISTLVQHENVLPKWSPSKLSEVTEELVQQYFEPTFFTSKDIQNELFGARYNNE